MSDHTHDREHPHGHDHDHDDHDHDQHPHHHDEHSHHHGIRGFLTELFVPHTHDSADAVDDALESSAAGVRALKISMFVLLGTTTVQFAIVLISGSVALFADTVHNFSDALTAVPLWIAFVLARQAPTRRYTFGYGRAEDLAGLFIVLVVAASAVVAAAQSIARLAHPMPLHNLWWVVAAGVVGFAGNEAVAVFRIRVGQRIGSAALVADGVHARTDGFTSLAVVVGAVGVMLGFPLADPLVGILISVAIVVLLAGTVRSIGRRLMDAVEPELVAEAQHALQHVAGIREVTSLRLRWTGHRLTGDAEVTTDETTLAGATALADEAVRQAHAHLPHLDDFRVRVR